MLRIAMMTLASAALAAGPTLARTNAAPVAAVEAAAPTPSAPQAEAKPKGDKICKRVALTGSRMPRLVCQTAEEWAAERR